MGKAIGIDLGTTNSCVAVVENGEPLHLKMTLTRAKFNELVWNLIEKTTIPVQMALSDAKISPSQLSKVLLVGGSTRIPAVQEKVNQKVKDTGKQMDKSKKKEKFRTIKSGDLAKRGRNYSVLFYIMIQCM